MDWDEPTQDDCLATWSEAEAALSTREENTVLVVTPSAPAEAEPTVPLRLAPPTARRATGRFG